MSKLIAIVDDEPDILELVSLHLKRAGYRTSGFLKAESFLNFTKTERPDLIILDLMLPDADGLEICKELKKKAEYSSIPIIMLTARGQEEDIIKGLDLGADDIRYAARPGAGADRGPDAQGLGGHDEAHPAGALRCLSMAPGMGPRKGFRQFVSCP